jgi:S1-C subfamily serine protease
MKWNSALSALVIGFGLISSGARSQPAVSPPPPAPPAPSPAPAPRAPAPAPSAAPPAAPKTPPPAGSLAPARKAPPTPGNAAAPAPSGNRKPDSSPEAQATDPRPGIVRLEREGRRIGLGAVLGADGRILTALSALGHGNFIQARFSDDSVASVRVVAADRPWDLALLAPEGVHWTQGLRASGLDAAGEGLRLRRFRSRGARLEESPVPITGRRSLLGRDGVVLEDVLVLGGTFAEDERGSPLFDDAGEVVALVVSACAPQSTQSCQLASFAAPVSALKAFLRKAPAREPLPSAYLGFRGVAGHEGSVAGVRVISVEPGSPAALAGLRADTQERRARGAEAADGSGDLVVAVEDVPVTTPEEMRDAINRVALAGPSPAQHAAGSAGTKPPGANAPSDTGAGATPNGTTATEHQVRVLLYGSGKFRQAILPLRAPRQLPQAGSAAPERPTSEKSAPAPKPPASKPPAPVAGPATTATPPVPK